MEGGAHIFFGVVLAGFVVMQLGTFLISTPRPIAAAAPTSNPVTTNIESPSVIRVDAVAGQEDVSIQDAPLDTSACYSPVRTTIEPEVLIAVDSRDSEILGVSIPAVDPQDSAKVSLQSVDSEKVSLQSVDPQVSDAPSVVVVVDEGPSMAPAESATPKPPLTLTKSDVQPMLDLIDKFSVSDGDATTLSESLMQSEILRVIAQQARECETQTEKCEAFASLAPPTRVELFRKATFLVNSFTHEFPKHEMPGVAYRKGVLKYLRRALLH